MTLTTELADAVHHHELTAFFQPQYDVRTGHIVGLEALCRWNHTERGLLTPDAFLEVAASAGLMQGIGEVMLDLALEEIAHWQERGHLLTVSVNISPAELSDADFVHRVAHRLASAGNLAESVVIEVTETPGIVDIDELADYLRELQSFGSAVSIDDFGAGQWSLSQLRAIPASELKIDKSLVQDESADALAWMAAIVQLSRSMGLRTVAEGIETPEQWERMRALGVDRVQGFMLARPMPHEQLERVLADSLL